MKNISSIPPWFTLYEPDQIQIIPYLFAWLTVKASESQKRKGGALQLLLADYLVHSDHRAFVEWVMSCRSFVFITLRERGEEKGEARKLELDHNHRGHGVAISFPVQSRNLMAQAFALITHLGNASIPFHFISSNQSHISKWICPDEKSCRTWYY